ncbi:MAG TPA: hypothetical protein ENK03_03715 [Candidatus Cloacimonetes bacterium]|nr:hypothetical protein [Candidatus Cloacimonadota bacterium]
MKKAIFFIMILLLLTSCSLFKTAPTKRFQTQLLPDVVKDLYFGMSMDKFEDVKNVKNMEERREMSFRYEYVEQIENAEFQSIIYYFDAKISSHPLYEMIFIFKDDVDVESYTRTIYGKPSIKQHLPFDEWCWKSGEGFQIVAWTFENKLVIVATIKKTEWAELNICGE